MGGVLLLAAAYYGAAKVGQTLRYTASVSAIWPPAGLGIAALYLWGLRWWPGVLLGEILVNGQLLLDDSSLPIGSLLGQQTGNMAEIIVGALLLRRLIGPRAAMDRVEQVGRDARGARRRDRDQRDGGNALDARRRRRRRVRCHGVLAHLVARRHLRRPGRPAAAARVGSRPGRGLAPHPNTGRAPP